MLAYAGRAKAIMSKPAAKAATPALYKMSPRLVAISAIANIPVCGRARFNTAAINAMPPKNCIS
jgi:hypothetical protein